MNRVAITARLFAEVDRAPLALLEKAGVEWALNSSGKHLDEDGIIALAADSEALIAGTEPITARLMSRLPRLRLISRVGIGLDSVDLAAAKAQGIQVAYTPDAPSTAVAELTAAFMLSMLRGIPIADASIRRGEWSRVLGRSLSETTVGVVGVNRIGKKLIRLLAPFGPRFLGNDLVRDEAFGAEFGLQWAEKERLYREADVITLHVPLTADTRGMIGARELAMMKRDAILINTARGGVVDEAALAEALRQGRLGGAALDVFQKEPYAGELARLDNCLLTCHMGSSTRSSRLRMEMEAAENVVAFFMEGRRATLIPEHEYDSKGQD
ncbi:MAG: phosphoglycerate dehydrogenase [Candidatus Tectomicrobia bacterium]|uniref:Phosphoglycerate dehydrogenase n=1 Tax=Tectimicrobiota bacterium TaxID=2528274 RepID=A0A932MLY2_UNCTE|nr:phosphoglycerate dehydrogenase [Candidatus Tectomicrobia bacterium]